MGDNGFGDMASVMALPPHIRRAFKRLSAALGDPREMDSALPTIEEELVERVLARLAAEERMTRQAARLLRDYEADAHAEDVQDVIRWLAVYDLREQRAADSQTAGNGYDWKAAENAARASAPPAKPAAPPAADDFGDEVPF